MNRRTLTITAGGDLSDCIVLTVLGRSDRWLRYFWTESISETIRDVLPRATCEINKVRIV